LADSPSINLFLHTQWTPLVLYARGHGGSASPLPDLRFALDQTPVCAISRSYILEYLCASYSMNNNGIMNKSHSSV